MEPKILVGSPVSDYHLYCTEDYLNSLQSLTYPNYDICLVDNSDTDDFYNFLKQKKINVIRKEMKGGSIREKIVECRNILRQKVLDENYDYFFSVEQDILLPKNALDRLIKENKKIVTGVYLFVEEHKGKKLMAPLLSREWSKEEIDYVLKNKEEVKKKLPTWYKAIEEENFNFENLIYPISFKEIQEAKEFLKIKSGGLGCLLIHRDVLEKVKFRYEKDKEGFDDVFFYKDAQELGFEAFAYTKFICKHLVDKRPWTLKLVNGEYQALKRK
ncbi:MAG: hypothetical protein HYS32_02080 [Candidatus Woesearchaeota archaeon]|nr:MAG: hypothetical protein HYS32_02080 [Candidatus Woesearchaeota archaeon]